MTEEIYQKYIESGKIISTDTRNITTGSLFFALKGEYFDGNKYAKSALKKGAIAAIIDDPNFIEDKTILVKNSLESLQELAKFYRKTEQFTVLGLTGTNGKTTTKELIRAVLSKKYNCSATKGNLNNHIGVPLTILSTPSNTDILIVEMGANHVGEIAQLCDIAQPDTGVITNIGKAHLEGFGGIKGVIKAKSELYNYLKNNNKTIFLNSSDRTLKRVVKDYEHIIKYGKSRNSVYALSYKLNENLDIKLSVNKEKIEIKTNLFGDYNVNNILAAACIGNYFSVDPKLIAEAITNYIPDNNRSQILRTKNNTLILDSYNANPSSIEAALNSFSKFYGQNKTIILGEMRELGQNSLKEHRKVIDRVNEIAPEKCFFIGKDFKKEAADLGVFFETTDKMVAYLRNNELSNNIIFIKGSRVNKLERLIELL